MRRLIVLPLLLVWANLAQATIHFKSAEESYAVDSNVPNPPFVPQSANSWYQGHVRSAVLSGYGAKALEWETTGDPAQTDFLNEINLTTVPTGAGPYYFGFVFKPIRVGGVNVWANPDGNDEAFDKAIEIVGLGWRYTVDFGIRSQVGPANTWSVFHGYPCGGSPTAGHFHGDNGHPCVEPHPPFTPTLEEYDNFWMNVNGYGRGQPGSIYPDPYYALQYDKWMALVVKYVVSTTATGSVEVWINGTKVWGSSNIVTSGSGGIAHVRMQLGGTYRQPVYDGRAHKRQYKHIILSDDINDLNGVNAGSYNLMTDPEAGGGSTGGALSIRGARRGGFR